MKLIGPFTEILTMDKLPAKGPLADDQLEVIPIGGLLIDDEKIVEVGTFAALEQKAIHEEIPVERITTEMVAIPGMIDAHTHLCWAGSRATDYAKRLSGKTYLEIAKEGGGIWSTVLKTREATMDQLCQTVRKHTDQLLSDGVTTTEVKSGYGLSVENELKMLWAIKRCDTEIDLIPTCLAAHILPIDFEGNTKEYLHYMVDELLPKVKEEGLSNRVDIFIEDSAFGVDEARDYLLKAKAMGFDLVVHGDQFSMGGSQLAVELGAVSVDHMEASDDKSIRVLAQSDVVSTVLPGASLGLGISFAPARKLIDEGACLVIASDWNPGSAPNGDLLMQASLLGAYEKLTISETLAGITVRAAKALKLNDRGVLKAGNLADIVAFPTNDYREIIYRQGKLKPVQVWKKGTLTPIRPR